MSLVYGEDARIVRWAAHIIGGIAFKDDAKAIGREINGELVAAVVFDSFSQCDCNIHIASDGSKRWLTRGFLTAAFAYPFIQCGFRRVTGLVPASNIDALNFDLKLGFKFEGRCQEAMPDGDDVIVLGMLRRECRFIPSEYRQ